MSFLQNLVFAGPFVYTLFYFVAILGLIRRTSDCLKALGIMVLVRISTRLRWSRGERAGLWYPSSRVQTRPKPSDFLGEKILSAPSFGGEVKPSVPCKFTACKRTQKWRGSRHFRQNSRKFSPIVPPSATGVRLRRQTLGTPCGERWNVLITGPPGWGFDVPLATAEPIEEEVRISTSVRDDAY